MIYSLENNKFGQKIKTIRKNQGLSLYDVSDKTGLKRQTISNIERGKCIPRIDTLDLLSSVYKVNIYKIFDDSRKVDEFTNLYKNLDLAITSLDLCNLQRTCDEIKHFVKLNQNNKQINESELKNINYFILLIDKIYHTKDVTQDEIKKILIHLEINDITNLNERYLNNRLFTFLEYRILMVLSMILVKYKNYEEGITLLNHCLENISNFVFDEVSELHLKLKIYLNLSYINYLRESYHASLEYAKLGIELATKNHSSYLLSQLYARKSVAELSLGMDTDIIEDDYIKSIALFYILNQKALATKYVDIFSKQYNIDSDTLDKLKTYILK